MPIIVDINLFDEIMVKVGGFGIIHVWLLITCGMFNMYMFVETMGSSIIIPTSQCDLGITYLEGGGSARVITMLGLLSSSYFMGYLADKIGRKNVLLYATIPALVFSWSAMLATNAVSFLILRFLTGVCLGGVNAAHLVYLGEFCTNTHRAIVIHYMAMFTAFGMLYVPGMATLVYMRDFSYKIDALAITYRPWRLLGTIFSVPGILGILLLIGLPESPKFLLVTNQHDKAMATMERVCHMNRKKTLLDFGINDLQSVLHYEDDLAGKGICYNVFHDAIPLFKKPLMSKFVLSCLIQFFMVSTGNGLTLWFSEIRGRGLKNYKTGHGICHEIKTLLEWYAKAKTTEMCNDRITTFNDALIMGASFIIGFNALGLVLRFVSRKSVFISALFTSCVFGLFTIWADREEVIRVGFILFLLFTVTVINLLGGAVVDFAPTYLRSKALALCSMSGRLGAIVSSNILGISLGWACLAIFHYFAFCPAIGAILAVFLPF